MTPRESENYIAKIATIDSLAEMRAFIRGLEEHGIVLPDRAHNAMVARKIELMKKDRMR